MKSCVLLLVCFTCVRCQLPFYPDLIDVIQFTIESSTVNTQCTSILRLLIKDFQTNQKWVLHMLDAVAKPQPGILEGNIMQVGSYDECLNIKTERLGFEIEGKYCTVPYSLEGNITGNIQTTGQTAETVNTELEPFRLSWGICVPSACKVEDLRGLWDSAKELLFPDVKIKVNFDENNCDYKSKEVPFTPMAIFAIVFFSLILLITILSTIYDLLSRNVVKREDTQHVILKSFSIYSNGKKLFNTNQNADNLGCLNGMRVISMMWIILTHRFMHQFFLPNTNLIHIQDWKESFHSSIVLGANFAVDTFFTISGLLVMYVFAKTMEKGFKFNMLTFVLHRFLRLTPALAAVVLFQATLVNHMGKGPFWTIVYDTFQKNCETNWWSTLLYIQNYVNPSTVCVGQSWYLAVDTQLYIISPLLLFPILRWPRITGAVILALTAASVAANFAITWVKHFGSVYFDLSQEQSKYIYLPTHTRMPPWLVGFLAGYVIYKTKNSKIIISKGKVILLWMFSLGILVATILGTRSFVEGEYDVVKSSIYNSLTKPGWALAICIISFLCIHGYGGIINKFLSGPIFTILIRVNYSMYLLHMLVLVYMIAQKQTPEYFTNMFAYHDFWGDFIYTVSLAMVLTLTCESPIIALEKVIFSKPKTSNHNKNNNESHQNLDDNIDGNKSIYINQCLNLDEDTNKIINNNIRGNDVAINVNTEESRIVCNS